MVENLPNFYYITVQYNDLFGDQKYISTFFAFILHLYFNKINL